AEGHVQALVQADGHPVAVDDAEIDRVAARDDGTERSDLAVVERRIAGIESGERLETADRIEDEMAATARRQLADLDAGGRSANGLDPLGAMRGEVGGSEGRRRD